MTAIREAAKLSLIQSRRIAPRDVQPRQVRGFFIVEKSETVMPQFRKKPVVIEAFQFPGRGNAETGAFHAWANRSGLKWGYAPDEAISIPTLEGAMIASAGDWIIKGVMGEFYPCKPDIFEATYDPVGSVKLKTGD